MDEIVFQLSCPMCSLARGYSASKPSPGWILSLRCLFIGPFVAVDAMALLVSLSLLIRPNSYRPLRSTTTVIVRSSQQGQWSLDSANISLQDLSNAVWVDACRGCQVSSNPVLVKGLVTAVHATEKFHHAKTITVFRCYHGLSIIKTAC